MKKHLLAASLTLVSASAIAQDYNFPYSYEEYQNSYSNQVVQDDTTYYENTYENSYENTQGLADYSQQAYNYNNIQPENKKPWNFTLTAGISNQPKYRGAKDNDTDAFLLPLPAASYQLDPWQKLYISIDEGAGYAYALTEHLQIGGGLGYRKGRNSKDADILTGMDGVSNTLTYLAAVRYDLNKFHSSIILEKGISDSNDGFTTQFTAGYKTKLNEKLLVGTEFLTTFGDDTYMKQNFSVSSADAMAGRAAYKADAGFYDAKVRVFSNYQISGPHSISGMATYTKLIGDAKDSSIVEDDTSLSLFAGYTYTF